MHWQRWISGLILAPSVVLLVLYAPPWLFSLFVLAGMMVGLREFNRLLGSEVSPFARTLTYPAGFVLALSMMCPDPRGFPAGWLAVSFLFFIAALGRREDFSTRVRQLGLQCLGLIYVVFLLGHLFFMFEMPQGRMWILFTLVAVYFGDTTAFYVGRAWGKRKMAPALSPNKTLEGALGAAGGSALGAFLFQFFFFPSMGSGAAILLGMAIGAAGQTGDLFESLLKRSAKAKDSGALIPGHGGLLDRIDSLMFALPLVYYCALRIP